MEHLDQPKLPSGVVTFLFSDIESSSQQWEADTDRMRAALVVHDTVIGHAINDQGGVVIKHLGDGVAAVFDDADAGVRAAIAIQVGLGQARWPDDGPLVVRIGLHTGEAHPTGHEFVAGHDYLGPTVNRAARVSDAANGSQTTCSQATVAAVERPNGYSFSFSGSYELKGVGVERLFVVDTPLLPTDRRALRARRIDNDQQRQFTNSFIGRAEQLATLRDSVRPASLVSVIGVGGVGKTRLVSEFVAQNAHHFPGGVSWVSLGPFDPGSAIAANVLNGLGVTRRPGLSDEASVAAFLDGSQSLLVLDNCEQVADAVATLVQHIAGTTSPPAVLCTSRTPLRTPAERLVHLGPLREPDDQVELFLSRVRERLPDRRFEAGEVDAIRAVCERLDGVPLSIELAGARVDVLSPGEIDELLGSIDQRGHLEEELQIHSTIEWSYGQLGPDERAVLCQLAVFTGPFTLDEAELLVESDAALDLYSVLVRLHQLSLLEIEHEGTRTRIRMIRIIREFGLRKLIESGRHDATQLRCRRIHVDIVVAASERVSSERESEGWSEIQRSWTDIRATVRNATDDGDLATAATIVSHLFYYSGYSLDTEVTDWALALLDHPEFETSDSFTAVAGVAAYGLFGRAELERSLEIALRGLERDPADTDGFCRIAGTIAAIILGDEVEAKRLLDGWSRASGTTRHSDVFAHGWQALYEKWILRSERSVETAAQAIDAANAVASPSAQAAASWMFGSCCAGIDDELALRALDQGLEMIGDLPSRHLIRQLTVGAQTDIALRAGHVELALGYCTEALQDAVRHEWLISATHLLGSAAIMLVRTGDAEDAARLIGAVERVGYPVRERAHRAVADELGDRVNGHIVLGRQLDLSAAVDLALHRLTNAIGERREKAPLR